MKGSLGFELVETLQSASALENEWRELLAASGSPELMLDPDWMLGWWDHYGEKRKLVIGLFRDAGVLVGLAPLCLRTFRYRPGIPFQRLELLSASGGERDGACGEYLGLIARRGSEQAVAIAFSDALAAGGFGRWDECVLEMMDGNGPMTAPLSEALRSPGRSVSVTPLTNSFYLPLAPSWDAYLGTLPSKRRKWFRRTWRTFLEWVGDRDYVARRATDEHTVGEGMRVLVELHTARWMEDGRDGAFASPRFHAFVRSFAFRLLRRGQLDLRWLEVDGDPVAAQCSFMYRDTLYFYQSGRRMNVPSSVQVGIVMLMLTIQDAMANGVRTFDFLGGDYAYKSYFTKHTRPLVCVRVARQTLREHLRRALAATLRAARAAKGWRQAGAPRPAAATGASDLDDE